MRLVRQELKDGILYKYWDLNASGPIDGPVERAERRALVAKSAAHQPAPEPQKKMTPAEQSNYMAYSASEDEIAELSPAELEAQAIARRKELNIRSLNGRR